MSRTGCRPEGEGQIGPGICGEIRGLLEEGMPPEAILDRLAGIVQVIAGEIADEKRKASVAAGIGPVLRVRPVRSR